MSSECNHCGTCWTIDESEIDENGLCPDCADDYVGNCNECGYGIFDDDYYSLNHNEIICNSCYEDVYCTCETCRDLILQDHAYLFSDYCTHEWYCESCFYEGFYTCSDCCEVYRNEDGYYYEESGYGPYCSDCYHENHLSGLNSWDFKPSFRVFLGKKEKMQLRTCRTHGEIMGEPGKGVPTFGIEIEVNTDYSGRSLSCFVDIVNDYNEDEFYYLMEDGSIAGQGFEIASHPFTLDSIKENDKRLDVFRELSKIGAKSYTSNDCGMHIHVGRSSFITRTHLYKFSKFIFENKEFIKSIANREGERLQEWASIDLSDNEKAALARWCSGRGMNQNRYKALNFQNHATVECRIFRGTLEKKTILRNIEFLHALIEMTKNKDIDHLKVSDLEDFVIDNSNTYPNFADYLTLSA